MELCYGSASRAVFTRLKIALYHSYGLVAMEAMSAIAQSDAKIENPDLLVLCALLHDTIEDTDKSFENITQAFGADIAKGVLALSKNDALATKREKMLDSLAH